VLDVSLPLVRLFAEKRRDAVFIGLRGDMKRVLASCSAVLFLGSPSPAVADDAGTYRGDAAVFHSRFDGSTDRSHSTGLLATYYFDALPLRPTDYPLGAEAFVERSASVTIDYSRASQKLDGSRRNRWSYGAQGVFRRPDTPLYAAASYSYYDGDTYRTSTGTEFDSYGKFYDLAAGAYLGRHTLLFLDWAKSVSRSVNYLSSGTLSFENASVSLGAGAQHLARLPSDQHVALLAHVDQRKLDLDDGTEDKSNTISLDATYYPARTLGLTAGLEYERGGRFFEGETWRAGVSWFVNPTLVLLLNVLQFDARGTGSGYDFISLAAFVRF
jgi:hypothetical protein